MPNDSLEQLVFGPVVIEWEGRWRFPIALDHTQPGRFVTQTQIIYRYGDGEYYLRIPDNYSFDGASIPWLIRIVPGFAKLDWHLLAALPHDFGCDNPNKIPRAVADGIFVSVLIALAENRKEGGTFIGKVQSYLMFLAVWTWTIATRIWNPPNNISKPPVVEVAPVKPADSVAGQVDAVTSSQAATKTVTATPPNPVEVKK
jgi:hypothetical protein